MTRSHQGVFNSHAARLILRLKNLLMLSIRTGHSAVDDQKNPISVAKHENRGIFNEAVDAYRL